MILVFYFFAAVLVLLSVKSLIDGLNYLQFFRTELSKPRTEFTPFVSVIVPCRGVDSELDRNLKALFEFDYSGYEIVFVVDDKDDPAVAVINEVRAASGRKRITSKVIIANKTRVSSQKVENLREAVLFASDSSEAFAFVDSDARPSSDWLRSLVTPLIDENIGAATGYRWFVAKNPTLASELRSAWNASIASALGPNTRSNFCWGGSMAIRRDTFERLKIRERWEGTLSDDFVVTRTMKETRLPIVFVPQALTASVDDCTFAQMLEFTTRQMKITRAYARPLWILSFFGSVLFNAVMISAFLIVSFSGQNGLPVYAAFATLLIVAFCSTGKAWLRLNAVKLALPDHLEALKRQVWTQNTLWLFTPAIFVHNSVAAYFSRRLTWRGTTYELKSATETVIIAD